jgi:hypothetical protein
MSDRVRADGEVMKSITCLTTKLFALALAATLAACVGSRNNTVCVATTVAAGGDAAPACGDRPR